MTAAFILASYVGAYVMLVSVASTTLIVWEWLFDPSFDSTRVPLAHLLMLAFFWWVAMPLLIGRDCLRYVLTQNRWAREARMQAIVKWRKRLT